MVHEIRTESIKAVKVPEDATLNELPLLPRERIWGFWDFSVVNIGLSIATWAFLQGATVSYYVGAKEAIASVIIGYGIAVLLVSLSPVLSSAKYGVEQFVMLRAIFGHGGARLVMITTSTIFAAAWSAILAIMLGHGLVNIINTLFGVEVSKTGAAVSVLGLIAIISSWIILSRGPVSVERVSQIVAPALVIILVVITVIVFTRVSWEELTAIPALDPEENPHVSFMVAIELGVAGGFAWWPNMGNLARLTRSSRAAFWPNWIGIFGASVFAALVGTFAALVLEITEPTDWLVPLTGTVFGVIALFAIAFANITAILSQGYGSMLALRSGGGRLFRHMAWPLMGVIILGPAAILVFFPEVVYENYGRFLSWSAILVAPLTGIGITDYFLLRRTRVPIRELYKPAATSAVGYWHGWNPVAFVALAAGAIVYTLLLHPITYVPSPLFPYMTASIPSCLVGALVYYVLTKAITQPMGLGGYRIETPVSTGVIRAQVAPATPAAEPATPATKPATPPAAAPAAEPPSPQEPS
ncbi:MAG: purine-cytosine permease family protein [Leucobacter sp.]